MSTIKVGKNEVIKSINEGIKICKANDEILLTDDYYYEKVIVNKNNITIKSDIKSIISYDDCYHKIAPDGLEYITVRTHSVIIKADNVKLINLCIENSAGRSYIAHQAVALHLYGDNIEVIDCTIKGSQDTLFTGPLPSDLIKRYKGLLSDDERLYNKEARHHFKNCHIIGDVDFIFGGGNDLFENCTIEVLNNFDKPCYIAAPSHDQDKNYGMVFKNCKIIGEAKKESVYLARPWREYGCVYFIDCELSDIIHPDGFSIWDNTNRHETCRFYELNSKGKGANNSSRVNWINKKR